MTTATAIVVARGGSVRLPNKALLPFAGSTLIGHKVWTLLRTESIGRVIVASDSDAILAEAAKHGAEPVRNLDYDNDTRRMIADTVGRVPNLADDAVVVWAHPTNPLVRPETYDEAVAAFEGGADRYDSLMSVREERRHAWYVGTPLNFSPRAEKHQLAAGLEPVLFQDGAIFIQTREAFLRTAYFYGATPQGFPVTWDEGVDIDDELDLVVALTLAEFRANPRIPTEPSYLAARTPG